MKYCQGPLCHTYDTKDRKRGSKGTKVNQSRRRSQFSYLQGTAGSLQGQDDWFKQFGEQAVNHFGRITQPKKMEEHNSWRKSYRWGFGNNEDRYIFYNMCTGEQRIITEQQYNDDNYTLNT